MIALGLWQQGQPADLDEWQYGRLRVNKQTWSLTYGKLEEITGHDCTQDDLDNKFWPVNSAQKSIKNQGVFQCFDPKELEVYGTVGSE